MNRLLAGSCCALILSTTPTLATTIYRCSDAEGNLTFTQQGCAIDQTARTQNAKNPTPGSGKAVPLANPATPRKPRNNETVRTLTVVGAPDDGCGNRITGSARRDALIKQQVRSGMTRKDIESTFGTPDTVTSRDGQVRYRYNGKQGRTRTINFDENGCVRGKK
ncbi:outer membrane protein assembly factor BamE domain-containing protein [Stutzerimonas zhaodongensis]|uniref:outer membrane protein assembly factor BamE domain-containing protein n=1 Tax=Stutzerimonas TaxID=2901164 RepID=UPI00388F932C